MEKIERTIKAISTKSKPQGTIGFLTEEEPRWYNVKAEEKVLDEILNTIIGKGNVVQFELENGFAVNFTLIEKAESEKNWSDNMTNFNDLLNSAHEKFKEDFSIKTEMIGDIDYKEKRAVFKATVIVGYGNATKEFTGYGDSENIKSDEVKKGFIRMAETRAIVRALRFATNNAMVAEEEIGDNPLSEEELAMP